MSNPNWGGNDPALRYPLRLGMLPGELPRMVFVQVGEEPSEEEDEFLGLIGSLEEAERIVAEHNRRRDDRRERRAHARFQER